MSLRQKIKDNFHGMTRGNWIEFSLWLLMAVALFVLDLVSKHVVYHKLIDAPGGQGFARGLHPFIPGFLDITLVFNDGAAWNIGAGMKPLLSMISLVMGLFLIGVYVFAFRKMPRFLRAGVALAIAGDIGNLIDRMGFWMNKGIYAAGGVIDFLVFDFAKSFPVFNVADSLLVTAVCLIILGYIIHFFTSRAARKKNIRQMDEEEVSEMDSLKSALQNRKPLSDDSDKAQESEDIAHDVQEHH